MYSEIQNTFVIGDIHGGLKALKQVLHNASVKQGDKLIFLGDYVDGWSESPQVIDFIQLLRRDFQCICIRGNHDDLLMNYLKTGTYAQEWFLHGGAATIEAYRQVDEETKTKHIAFLESLQDYYLDDNNRLFLHAGFTNLKGVTHEYFKKLLYWDRTLWETALALDASIDIESDLYPQRFKIYKEVFIGHTPTTRIGLTVPIKRACVWNLDTGAAFTGPLTIMNVETNEFWQSDALPDLYPNENGRN
jgi:serine/threonine protein phosphatase 1